MNPIFEKWYYDNLNRFHSGQFDEKQIAYSAWLAGAEYVDKIRINECNHNYPVDIRTGGDYCKGCGKKIG